MATTKKKTTKAKKKKSAAKKTSSNKSLVIVESPAKANTIRKYLGRNYDVKASVGHVRDLPKSKLGVDPENDFAIKLVTIKGKAPILKELKAAAKKAKQVFLAPDPDREGEAIAQHIHDAIGSPDKISRIMFNEITKKAILNAIENPHKIDENKVDAQQTRRALDRIVGYKLSPLLWDKVRSGLSAGRVQSVALRILVDREKEIEAFDPKEYWSVTTQLSPRPNDTNTPPFEAKLFRINGEKFELNNEEEAQKAVDGIKANDLTVKEVTRKDRKRNAAAPFITSTMQQAASQKYRFAASRTMRIAQKLYEGIDVGDGETAGLITYMRTDSTRTADEALTEVRDYIKDKHGSDYLPETPNTFKVKKSAQEGHEAIRPTSVARTPEAMKQYLDKDQYKLYDLIWKRFVASQMAPAVISTLTVDVQSGQYTLRATGSKVKFPGFLSVYGGEDNNGLGEQENLIPELAEGSKVNLDEITPNQHFTQPPPRYTEATLIKELEDKGIGRPSTYASIMSTIQSRDYVESIDRKLHPTDLGKLISDILVEHFPRIMDVGFTAGMEEHLDQIESGDLRWKEVMREYYQPFMDALEAAEKNMKNYKPEVAADEVCEKCGNPMTVKFGRFGKFLACSGYPDCKNTKQIARDGTPVSNEPVKTGEKCPECDGGELVVKNGKFGKFIACTNYPDCKFTKPFTLGIKCPKGCGGEMVERRSKKGRTFYGCTNYPKCDFTSWEKPFEIPCEKCGNPYLVFAKQLDPQTLMLKCPVKECDYTREYVKDEEEVKGAVKSS